MTSDRLVAAMREHRFRITRPRAAICDVLTSAVGEHLSAAEIMQRARAVSDVEIDQSTVYRTLDTLEDIGLVRHVHLGHGPGVYHLTDDDHHHHLVCVDCGRSEDVPVEDVSPLLTKLAAKYGYALDARLHFAISAQCADCAAAPSTPGGS